MLVAPISRARAMALRTALSMTAPLVRRSRSSETAWMTAFAARRAGRRHDRLAERDGRLAHGRELDRVATGALDRATDPGRHPQREVRGIDDGVDLEVADVAVPELDARQLTLAVGERPQTDRSGGGMVHPGQPPSHRGDDLPRFVVRSRATSADGDRSLALRTDEDELVVGVDRRPGDVGHVDHDGVHGDVADERDAPAADEDLRAVRQARATSRRRSRAAASRSGSAAPS